MVSPVLPPTTPALNPFAPDFDPASPEALAAQRENWYATSPLGLLVIRYAEAHAFVRDRRVRNDGKSFMEMSGVFDGPVHDWFAPMIIHRYGEDHSRLRGLMTKVFTPRMVDGLRPMIRAILEELVEPLEPGDEYEFVNDLGLRLPLTVMCELLGVPPEDYERFGAWSADLGLVFMIGGDPSYPARVENAVVGMTDYCDRLIRVKTANPGDDLVSRLITAYRADGRITRDELLNLLVTLVFAAHDSTRHQLANAMIAFAEHPDQWLLLRERPELTDQAVEEALRYSPSAIMINKFAVEDIDFQGVHIPRGAFVGVQTALAQRDPLAFENPNRFDITLRRDAAPLLFGGGPHHCLGAALARAELAEAFRVLTRRLGPPTVAAPYTWQHGVRGPDRLLLRFG